GSGFSAAAEVLLAAGLLAFSRDGTAAGLLATAEVDAAGGAAALEDSGGSGKVGVGFAEFVSRETFSAERVPEETVSGEDDFAAVSELAEGDSTVDDAVGFVAAG